MDTVQKNRYNVEKKKGGDTRMKLTSKIRTAATTVCLVLVLAAGLGLGIWIDGLRHREPELTPVSVSEQLKTASDLATARLDYRGLVRYEEGSIRFLTKKSFTMLYDARITAGIDLEKAQIEVDGKEIRVTLPPAEIRELTIDPKSLEFYDEKFALFNTQDREDTVVALQEAEANAREHVGTTELLALADQQAERVVEKLLSPLNWQRKDPYTVTVKRQSGT